MTITIWGTDNVAWTHIRHELTVWHRDELRIWINENIEGDYRVTATHIYFEQPADATLFTLKYK